MFCQEPISLWEWHWMIGIFLWVITRKGLYSVVLSGKSILFHPCLMNGQVYEDGYNNIYSLGSMLYLGTTEKGIITFDKCTRQFAHWMDLGHVTSLSGNGKDMLMWVQMAMEHILYLLIKKNNSFFPS